MIKRISQRTSRKKHSPGPGKTALTKILKCERPRPVPQSEGTLANAGKIARGQTTWRLGVWAVKFGFYSEYHRKSLKLLNKDYQRNKSDYAVLMQLITFIFYFIF